MTPEQQRIAIAEFRGWKNLWDTEYQGWRGDNPDGSGDTFLPDYLKDLDAMHEVEIHAGMHRYPLREMYYPHLIELTSKDDKDYPIWMATAAQRAEAFLRTIGKWVES